MRERVPADLVGLVGLVDPVDLVELTDKTDKTDKINKINFAFSRSRESKIAFPRRER